MLNLNQFKKALLEELNCITTGVVYNEIIKNGFALTGIVFTDYAKENNAFPTFYVENLYQGYLTGESIPKIARVVCNRVASESTHLEIKGDLSKLVIEVVNKACVPEGAVHRDFLDLSIIVRQKVVIEVQENAMASFIVTKNHMYLFNLTEDELIDRAISNCANDYCFTDMFGILVSMGLEDSEELPKDGAVMYVGTNTSEMFGAAILTNNKVLAQLADTLSDDFFIMPSSVHEIICVPASDCDADALAETVCDVNKTQVLPEELLSYTIIRETHIKNMYWKPHILTG